MTQLDFTSSDCAFGTQTGMEATLPSPFSRVLWEGLTVCLSQIKPSFRQLEQRLEFLFIQVAHLMWLSDYVYYGLKDRLPWVKWQLLTQSPFTPVNHAGLRTLFFCFPVGMLVHLCQGM